jgi:hypothetical protein
MCHAIPEPGLVLHKITRAKRTYELLEAWRGRVEPGAYLAESQKAEAAGQ